MSVIHKGTKIASNAVTGDTLPIGTQVPFTSLDIPDNWLLCDGSAISRVNYSELFNVIGISYGDGDGTTTFNLPNKKGRTSVGYDASQAEFNEIGKTGGSKTHTLTKSELPRVDISTNFAPSSGGDGSGLVFGTTTGNSINGLVSNVNFGGLAHNNLQPYQTDVYIIKAKQSAGVIATVVDDLLSDSPINALSANQGKVLNNKYTKHIIALSLASTVTGLTTNQIVNFTNSEVVGTKLSLSGGKVVIGSDVSKVIVSGAAFIESSGITNYVWAQIRKNGTNVANHLIDGPSIYKSASIAPKLISVSPGDTIEIYIDNTTPTPYKIRGGADTFLTVEVVE